MQCGSTGLGNMALKMRMEDESKMTKLPPTRPPEGSLIMYCKTYDPVIWCVWIGIEPEDMGSLLRLFFKKETMAFVFKSLFRVMASKCRGLLYREKSTEEVVEIEAKEKMLSKVNFLKGLSRKIFGGNEPNRGGQHERDE